MAAKSGRDFNSKKYNSYDQLIYLLVSQFCGADSLRNICDLFQKEPYLYETFGVKQAPKKSGLAEMNEKRDCDFFGDIFYMLRDQLHFSNKKLRRMKRHVQAIDSTYIGTLAKIFKGAKRETIEGGLKVHTVSDVKKGTPYYAYFSDKKGADNIIAQKVHLCKNSVVVADRGYFDFALFRTRDTEMKVDFVCRAKDFKYKTLENNHRTADFLKAGVKEDKIVMPIGVSSGKKYTLKLFV